MKNFKYDDLKGNKLFALIVDSYYSDIKNFGRLEYGRNFREEDFFEVVSLVLNQFYLLKNKNTSIIEFKGEFLRRKKEAERGTIEFNLKDEKRTYKYYDGNFVYYVIMTYLLSYRFFYQEIESKEDDITRLSEFLEENYLEIKQNPINPLLIEKVSKPFEQSDFTTPDMADYMGLLMNQLKSHYVFEDKQSNKDFDMYEDLDDYELEGFGLKILFMKETGILDFLIEKYDLTNKPNHLSRVVRAFTGFNLSTINNAVTPMYNSVNDQKNNPYSNHKNLPKVEAKMIELMLKK
jgi:hypothetical protein